VWTSKHLLDWYIETVYEMCESYFTRIFVTDTSMDRCTLKPCLWCWNIRSILPSSKFISTTFETILNDLMNVMLLHLLETCKCQRLDLTRVTLTEEISLRPLAFSSMKVCGRSFQKPKDNLWTELPTKQSFNIRCN